MQSTQLQGEVDRLHKLLADAVRNKQGSGYTVIHTGRHGWAVVVVPGLVAGGALYLYCRLTGRSVLDLFFVTNRSMADFRASVTESIKVGASMGAELRAQRARPRGQRDRRGKDVAVCCRKC